MGTLTVFEQGEGEKAQTERGNYDYSLRRVPWRLRPRHTAQAFRGSSTLLFDLSPHPPSSAASEQLFRCCGGGSGSRRFPGFAFRARPETPSHSSRFRFGEWRREAGGGVRMEGALTGRQSGPGPGSLGWAGRKRGQLWGVRFSLCPAPWDHLSPLLSEAAIWRVAVS